MRKCKENVERKVLQCSVQSHSNSFGVSYHDRTIFFFFKNTLVYLTYDIHFPGVLFFFIVEWQISKSGLRTLTYAANCPAPGIKEHGQNSPLGINSNNTAIVFAIIRLSVDFLTDGEKCRG